MSHGIQEEYGRGFAGFGPTEEEQLEEEMASCHRARARAEKALAAERAASAEREEAVRELVKAVHAFGPCEFDPIDAALARLAAAWPAVVDGGEGG